MSKGTHNSTAYEPPRLTVLGTVQGLTLQQDKRFGGYDGFTFLGTPITNNST
jgi:hypothetical protein